jgi:hypothetical protein
MRKPKARYVFVKANRKRSEEGTKYKAVVEMKEGRLASTERTDGE